MRVNGKEIPQYAIDKAIARMRNGEPFTCSRIATACQHSSGERLADRLLQRERKAGNIIYRGGMWHWVGPR